MELKYRNAFNDYYHVLVLIVPYGIEIRERGKFYDLCNWVLIVPYGIEIRVEGYYMIMDSEY